MARSAAALAALSLALCVALGSAGLLPSGGLSLGGLVGGLTGGSSGGSTGPVSTVPTGPPVSGEIPVLADLLANLLKSANLRVRPGAQCASLVEVVCDLAGNNVLGLCNLVCFVSGCKGGSCQELPNETSTCVCDGSPPPPATTPCPPTTQPPTTQRPTQPPTTQPPTTQRPTQPPTTQPPTTQPPCPGGSHY